MWPLSLAALLALARISGLGVPPLPYKLPYRRVHPSLSHICRYPLLMGGASGVRERERVTVREYPVFPPRVYNPAWSRKEKEQREWRRRVQKERLPEYPCELSSRPPRGGIFTVLAEIGGA